MTDASTWQDLLRKSKYPTEWFKVLWVHEDIKLLAWQIAPDTLNLLWADVNQTCGRNKHFPQRIHRIETLDFPRSPHQNSGLQEFLKEIWEILEEFPVWDVYWSDDESRKKTHTLYATSKTSEVTGMKTRPIQKTPELNIMSACHTHTYTLTLWSL